MSEIKFGNFGDSVRLLLTGDSCGNLSSLQRVVLQNMLSEKRRELDSGKLEARNLPQVQYDYVLDEDRQIDTIYYIPDLLNLMVIIHSTNNEFSPRNGFPNLPVNLDYLYRLKRSMLSDLEMNDWLATAQGQKYWDKVIHAIEQAQELARLKRIQPAVDSSENEIRISLMKKLELELADASSIIKDMNQIIKAEYRGKETLSTTPNWHVHARKWGIEISNHNPRLNLLQIAEKVRTKMEEGNIRGQGDRIPSAETIRRHALTGIQQ